MNIDHLFALLTEGGEHDSPRVREIRKGIIAEAPDKDLLDVWRLAGAEQTHFISAMAMFLRDLQHRQHDEIRQRVLSRLYRELAGVIGEYGAALGKSTIG